jgi:hypothetical protein
VHSPLLYSLFRHISNSFIKFADNTTVLDLIANSDEVVRALVEWCQVNNLSLNVNKMKELIVDFRKQHAPSTSTGLQWRG